jgi:phospholipid/cholesterol/gamma-HCH transport system substrate-binding protein
VTRGVKVRLVAFLVLSSVGVVYVAAAYLGFVDRVLGRGLTLHATLPTSGGLFEGSEVTYRGVKIGKVDQMRPTREGVELDLEIEEGTRLPLDSALFVHNLSAVGEQYLDLQPEDGSGPYAEDGDTLVGGEESMPVTEEELLVELDDFVQSVDKENLGVVIGELGTLFEDSGRPLQRLIDNGSRFVDEASAHEDETRRLLANGLRVLRTQQQEGENIRGLSRNLALLTGAIAGSDRELRTVLQDTPGAAAEVERLLVELEPTMPVLLGNLVTVNQVVVSHLGGVEQLLVAFPRGIASGFTGTPGDGYGHVNLQFSNEVGPCRGEGYKPVEQWRRGDELSDGPIFPARCAAGEPFNQRGSKYAPRNSGPASPGRAYRGSFDPESGLVDGAVSAEGGPVSIHSPANLSVLGDDAWKWLLAGPVAEQ